MAGNQKGKSIVDNAASNMPPEPIKLNGGVHPSEKKITAGSPIDIMPGPAKAIFPVSQHIGAPARPIVKIGDRVLRGQTIAEAVGFVSAPVHSSISGEVIAIGSFPHPMGKEALSIVVENDVEDASVEFEQMPPFTHDAETIRRRIQAAGVVGLGGATFPTHVKLSPPDNKPIDVIILNGAECEPYLTSDHRTMVERPDIVLKGMISIIRCVRAQRGIIGIEKNKPDAIEALREKTQGYDYIDVVPLNVGYPQGSEKHLIKTLTDRSVPPGGLPMDVGVAVQNVATSVAIYNAVAIGKPYINRIITCTGPAIVEPKNLKVRVGTPFFEVIDYCGGLTRDVSKVIMGGPMMGIAQCTLNVPVIKGTSGILALSKKYVTTARPRACIRCASCVDACPMNLVPCDIVAAVEKKDWKSAYKLDILSCIECGSCAYACPSKRPLVQVLRQGKAEVMKERRAIEAAANKKEKE